MKDENPTFVLKDGNTLFFERISLAGWEEIKFWLISRMKLPWWLLYFIEEWSLVCDQRWFVKYLKDDVLLRRWVFKLFSELHLINSSNDILSVINDDEEHETLYHYGFGSVLSLSHWCSWLKTLFSDKNSSSSFFHSLQKGEFHSYSL